MTTIESRITRLEQEHDADSSGPITIRVMRIPPDVPEDARDEYIRAHPECVSKVVEVPGGGGQQ
jgi:hypothetical protein